MKSDASQPASQHTTSTWLIPLASLLVTGALLGMSTNFAKYAGTIGLAPLAFLAWSTLGAALILLAWQAVHGQLAGLTARTLEYFIFAALFGVAGPNLIFFSAVAHVGAGFVILVITLPPLLTYAGALAMGIERFQAMRAAGVALALAGAAVLAMRKIAAPDADLFWIALTLCGPVLLAIGNLYRTLRWPPGHTASELVPGMMLAAALMLLAAGATPGLYLAVTVDGVFPYALIILQAIMFAVQNLLLFVLQKTGGPVLLSLLGSVGAVIGVPSAVFLLGETPPDGLAIAATLIAAGVALVTLGAARLTSPPTQKH